MKKLRANTSKFAKILNQVCGFTILEILIVVIVVGVLASLALPKFFSIVERTRATEAIVNAQALRGGLERLYVASNGNIGATCIQFTPTPTALFNCLGVDNPNNAPNAHFTYGLWVGGGANEYGIIAIRNSYEGGNVGDTVRMENFFALTPPFQLSGTSAFAGIGNK